MPAIMLTLSWHVSLYFQWLCRILPCYMSALRIRVDISCGLIHISAYIKWLYTNPREFKVFHQHLHLNCSLYSLNLLSPISSSVPVHLDSPSSLLCSGALCVYALYFFGRSAFCFSFCFFIKMMLFLLKLLVLVCIPRSDLTKT